ncbi:unnamed protein product [Boreogadus saida]
MWSLCGHPLSPPCSFCGHPVGHPLSTLPQVFKTLLITNTEQPEKSSVHCASPLELSLAAVLFLVALH